MNRSDASTNPLLRSLVLYYILGDHLLFLAYKIGRQDLYHWVPLEGAASLVQSLVARVGMKAITDFTGVAQFRAAGELGGVGWIWSQATALLASLAATHAYAGGGGGEGLTGDAAWTIVGALSGLWILFFGGFLLLMKRKYGRERREREGRPEKAAAEAGWLQGARAKRVQRRSLRPSAVDASF
jgi:hypothetical protein